MPIFSLIAVDRKYIDFIEMLSTSNELDLSSLARDLLRSVKTEL